MVSGVSQRLPFSRAAWVWQQKGRAAMLCALLILGSLVSRGQTPDPASKAEQAKQLMSAGRFEEAIPIYNQLSKADPSNPGWRLNLGLAQHMAGHDREAVITMESVLKTQPGALPALVSLGAARLALNEPEKAITPLRRALKANSADQETRGMLASA